MEQANECGFCVKGMSGKPSCGKANDRTLSDDVRPTKSDYKVVGISECPVDSHCEQLLSGDVSAVSSTEQSVVSDFAEVCVIVLCSIFQKKCHSGTLKCLFPLIFNTTVTIFIRNTAQPHSK
jgi:hypothetical protein